MLSPSPFHLDDVADNGTSKERQSLQEHLHRARDRSANPLHGYFRPYHQRLLLARKRLRSLKPQRLPNLVRLDPDLHGRKLGHSASHDHLLSLALRKLQLHGANSQCLHQRHIRGHQRRRSQRRRDRPTHTHYIQISQTQIPL